MRVCVSVCVSEQRETNVASWTVFNFSTARERERAAVCERESVGEERKEERGGEREEVQSEALLDFVHFFVFLVGLKIPPFRCSDV